MIESTEETTLATKDHIRLVNDTLRVMVPHLPRPHMCVMTRKVQALTQESKEKLFNKVRTYSDFSSENDPYLEHDAGWVDVYGEHYMWKFDYYDENFENLMEDGTRVMTIMHTSEY